MTRRHLGFALCGIFTTLSLLGCAGDDGSGDDGSSGLTASGGSSAGGSSTGGSSTGGSSAGGKAAGGNAAGGTSAGGASAGGTSAGGQAAGGDTGSGGTAAGGDTGSGGSGGTAAGGDTGSGGTAAGGDTGSGGTAAGGAGQAGAAGMAAGGAGQAGSAQGGAGQGGSAAGGAAATYNVSLVGSGFDPHNGTTFGVALVEGDKTIGSAFFPMGGGVWQVDWPGAAISGKAYKVAYFADMNNNAQCDAPETDHVWEQDLGTASANIEKSIAHDTTFKDSCAELFPDPATGVVLHGTGYDPHTGGIFGVAVVDAAGKVMVRAITQLDPSAAADFTFTFLGSGMTGGGKYKLHYFGDLNGDGQCTAPPGDHAWASGEVTATDGTQAQVDVAHDDNFADICAAFQ